MIYEDLQNLVILQGEQIRQLNAKIIYLQKQVNGLLEYVMQHKEAESACDEAEDEVSVSGVPYRVPFSKTEWGS